MQTTGKATGRYCNTISNSCCFEQTSTRTGTDVSEYISTRYDIYDNELRVIE